MINPWRKIIAVFRLVDNVKFLYRRIAVMSRNLSDLSLIYKTEAEIKEAIRNYEALHAKTDGRYSWDRDILALKDELKRREMMRQENQMNENEWGREPEMITIEELKDLKEWFRLVTGHLPSAMNATYCYMIDALIDAEIERQSVTET